MTVTEGVDFARPGIMRLTKKLNELAIAKLQQYKIEKLLIVDEQYTLQGHDHGQGHHEEDAVSRTPARIERGRLRVAAAVGCRNARSKIAPNVSLRPVLTCWWSTARTATARACSKAVETT